MVQNDKKLCLSHTSWMLFMVHMYKMVISPCSFSFFHFFFDYLGCQGAESAKNGPKWQKFLSVAPYISGTIYDLHLWYTCKYFFIFIFFKILIFRIIWGVCVCEGGGVVVKGQKMAQNDKKFCLSHSISQEPCIIWLWFLVNIGEMLISSYEFLWNFDFWGF